MKKKIAIVGKGTAGCFALTHFIRWTDAEIDFYYDPKINPQAVGEGSTLAFPTSLYNNIAFQHDDLKYLDGTVKTGIKKTGWSTTGKDFIHGFPPPYVGYHFNAVKFQNFIFDNYKNKINIIEKHVAHDDIDADFIMDCSGKPTDYSDFVMSEYIPVNSVYVTQCFWDHARFNHTLTLARPYGWVFGIPLNNRCSIGYMYNNNINTLEEVKEDVKNIFEEYNLIPSDTTNSFSFKNYYRKKNHTNRVSYNGNASFFLEPLEATSIGVMDQIQRASYDIWYGNFDPEILNKRYDNHISRVESMIMLHYLSGSKFKSKFWDFAQERGERRIRKSLSEDSYFRSFVEASKNDFKDLRTDKECGSWAAFSYKQNLNGLDLYDKIDTLLQT
jgi:hypothetical protein